MWKMHSFKLVLAGANVHDEQYEMVKRFPKFKTNSQGLAGTSE